MASRCYIEPMREMDRATFGPADKPDAIGAQGEGSESQELKMGTPLGGVLDFSNRLTSERNERFLRTNSLRVQHLLAGGGEVLDTLERVKPEQKMRQVIPSVLAKVTLRVFTVLQGLQNKKEIIGALKNKFPESGCSYCGHKPCACSVMRPEEKVDARSSDAQSGWTIGEWQKHLKDVYGHKNAEQGIRFIYGRLLSEMNEANVASMQIEMLPDQAAKYWQEAISELADSFAWVAAVANELNIDLEKAYVERYGKGCPNCGQFSCQCGPFTFVQERKAQ